MEYSVTLADKLAANSKDGVNKIVESIEQSIFNQRYNITTLRQEAKRAVAYFRNHHFEIHKSAQLWCPEIVAVFGNDGYKQRHHMVSKYRNEFATLNIQELAFAVDDESYSWCILIHCNDAFYIRNIIWDIDVYYNPEQRRIAFSRLHSLKEPINITCTHLYK